MVVKCANTMSPMAPSASSVRSLTAQRLVVIVLADQHDAPGAIAGVADRLVVGHGEERRLLDQHVLAGGERAQRQIEVEPRRHGDDHRVDTPGSAMA